MLLLAIDTSGPSGSIALAQCGPGDACRVLETVTIAGGTFSAQLVPQIAALLDKHAFTKRDLAGFAVASGPGSFTGLRVGLAAVKALAEVLHQPIATISLLEAVATVSGRSGRVTAALDAGRNEMFVGEYEVTASGAHETREFVVSRGDWPKLKPDSVIVTPDQTVADAARAHGCTVQRIERPRSDEIARLGWKRTQAGRTVSTEDLEANYIRRSDAEIFSKPALDAVASSASVPKPGRS